MTNKLGKKQEIAFIIVLLVLLVAIVVTYDMGSGEGGKNIHELSVKVLSEKNVNSFGYNVRISSILLSDGSEIDLEEYEIEDKWTCGVDPGILGYYGEGNSEISFVVDSDEIVLGLTRNQGSGIVEIYLDGKLYQTVDLYTDKWMYQEYVLSQKSEVYLWILGCLLSVSVIIISIILMAFIVKKSCIPCNEGKGRKIQIVLFSMGLAFFYAINNPLELYFANIDEFWFDLKTLFPIIVVSFGLFFLFISFTNLLIFRFLNRFYLLFMLIQVSMFFAIYIQGNFFTAFLPPMDGSVIEWKEYSIHNLFFIASLMALVGIATLIIVNKKNSSFDFFYWSVGAVNLMLLLTIITFGVTNDAFQSKTKLTCTKENEFTFSSDTNFVILLLDAVDGKNFYKLISDNKNYQDTFCDFTFFRDTIGAYSFTSRSIPFILSGEWYENEQKFSTYMINAMNESPLLEQLENEGFEINIYDKGLALTDDIDYERITNFKPIYNTYSSFTVMLKDYLLMGGIKFAPYFLKYEAYNAITEFDEIKLNVSQDSKGFSDNNSEFYSDVQQEDITVSEAKQFKFIHVVGGHVPFVYDEYMNKVEESTYEQQLKGCVLLVDTYLKKMKEGGVYDNSVIIVMSDHGFGGESDYNPDRIMNIRQNPILLIKGKEEKHEYKVSEAPISFEYLQDIYSLLLQNEQTLTIEEKYNNNINPRRYLFYEYLEDGYMEEYVQEGPVWMKDTIHKTGNVFTR